MKFVWIIGSIFLFLFSSPLKAVTDEEKEAAKKLNEEILFQQEQEKRAEESKLPPVILDSSVDQLKKAFDEVQQDLIAPKKQGKCFQIFVIKLNGNSLFSQKKLEKIYIKYLFRCIFKKDIDELIAELHLLYHDRGYSLARIFVNEESNFLIGDLIIEILEGRIQKITIENKNKTQKIKNNLRRKTAFPFLEKKVFNIFEIEQGLKQINRLKFSQARMKIFPADKLGFSEVKIALEKEKHISLKLGAASREEVGIGDIYGEHNYNFNFGLEDTLGFNESFSLAYTRAEFDNQEENLFSRSYSSNLSFPIGYYTFSSAYSGSAYSQPQLTRTQEFISNGDSDNVSFSLAAVILKRKGKEMSLRADTGANKNRVFVDDILVEVSSRKLAVATLNLIGNFTLGRGSLQSTLFYREGVTWFGAKKDAPNIPEENPHAQYSLWANNTSYSISFIKKFPINYTTRVYAQTADKEVYTTIGIGGSGSVRGYSSNNHSDDIGWYQQHSISVRPLQRISALGSFAQAMNFSIFYDYGCVESSAGDKNYRCLTGRGASLSLSYKWFSLSYSYETPVHSTTTFSTEEPIVERASASIFYEFGF